MKNLGGRPKTKNNRVFSVRFSVNKEEHEIINTLFNNSSYLKKSDMYRDIIFNNEYKFVTTDNDMLLARTKLYSEVNHIGNNFNQLVKNMNQKKAESFSKDERQKLLYLMQQIEIKYKEILENIKK
jgi:hypothetical protein